METQLQNLSDFIEENKKYFSMYLSSDSNHEWGDEIWGLSSHGWLGSKRSEPLNLSEILRISGVEKQKIHPHFQDFIRACLVNRYSMQECGISVFRKLLGTLKRIYGTLYSQKGCYCPTMIDNNIIEGAIETLSGLKVDNRYNAVLNFVEIQRLLVSSGIVAVNLTVENDFLRTFLHSNYTTKSKREIQANRAKKSGSLDDSKRDNDRHLLSTEAMLAWAQISNSAENKYQLLGIRIFDLILCTGMRVNEILFLPRDCLISRRDIPEDQDLIIPGVSDLESDVYGLRYFAEKNSDARIHWLEPRCIPVVKRALGDILRITDQWNKQARYLIETEGKSVLPKALHHNKIPIYDLMDLTYNPTSFLEIDDTQLGYKKRTGLSLRRERWKKLIKRRLKLDECPTKLTQKQAETVIRADLFSGKLTLRYKHAKERMVRLDEMLIVAPPGALALGRGCNFDLIPQAIPSHSVNSFMGALPLHEGIFDHFDFREEDGTKIGIKSHMPRHQINTMLALMEVSDHLQAMAMGRRDPRQNQSYDHRNLKENQQAAASSDNWVNGLSESPSLPEFRDQSEKNETRSLVQTPNEDGFVEHILNEGFWDPALDKKTNIETTLSSLGDDLSVNDYVLSRLQTNTLIGELQDTYNEVKGSCGEVKASSISGDCGFKLHYLPNGMNCSRDLASLGCDKAMACLGGGPCPHLCLTGRPGELKALQARTLEYEKDLNAMQLATGDENTHLIQYRSEIVRNSKRLLKLSEAAHAERQPLRPYLASNKLKSLGRARFFIDVFANNIPQK